MNDFPINRRPAIEPRVIVERPYEHGQGHEALSIGGIKTFLDHLDNKRFGLTRMFPADECENAEKCLEKYYVVIDRRASPRDDLLKALDTALQEFVSRSRIDRGDGEHDFRKPFYRESIQVHPPSVLETEDPYRHQQQYLNGDCVGIHVGNALVEAKEPVQLVDVEQGWGPKHEDLPNVSDIFGINYRFRGHGTAVLGILAAERNGKGGVGILPRKLEIAFGSQHWLDKEGKPQFTTADAMYAAICGPNAPLKRGDILLLQTQYRADNGELLPSEVEGAVHCLIQCATAKGILVVEAVGNGALVLDDVKFRGIRPFVDRADSGALIVAAASSGKEHYPLHFTNRGTRVGCFAWGEEVTTCGDGETGQEEDEYRADFGGTSAAAAIVAGAAALIQSVYRGVHGGESLSPRDLRDWLMNPLTGVDRTTSGIGVMPDVVAILKAHCLPYGSDDGLDCDVCCRVDHAYCPDDSTNGSARVVSNQPAP